jgi:hypothetical protein
VDPRTSLDAKENNLAPAGNRTPDVQPVSIPTEVSHLRQSSLLPSTASLTSILILSSDLLLGL